MTWRLGQRPLRRVLVTRLRYLGDIVMSTVVLEALRHGDPGLEIGYLCEAGHAPVLVGQPGLSRIHALGSRRRGGDARVRRESVPGEVAGVTACGTVGVWRQLREARYDLAVDLFFNPRSAWLLKGAGIPRRLAGPAGSRGWLYTHQSGEPAAARHPGWSAAAPGGLGDHLARLTPLTHEESGLDFVAWFLKRGHRACPRLGARPGGRARAAAVLRSVGLDDEAPLLVLIPGATWPTKRWPTSHWRELAGALAAAWSGNLAVLTPPGPPLPDVAPAPVLPAGRGAVLPALPLGDVLDLLSASRGVVAVDGGLMHAAVALGVPTVALFGPTDPRLWFPYEGAGPFRVLATRPACHPCDLHTCDAFICLPELRPEAVLSAALPLFGSDGRPRS